MNINLVLALHFHQPVGNFDSVFESAVSNCYRPVVEHFERHKSVRSAFHLSGCLLEWLEKNDRKLLDQIFALVARKQIEPLGGGFYEPILSVIPREDALEQIARLSHYWKKRCGVTPLGSWLPERVWEPSMAELLATAKIRYTILDDQHLRYSGLVRDRMTGLFITERHGKPIACFPSDYQLRYLIPFRPMENVREHFEHLSHATEEITLTYGDDVEKFGVWPGTHQWVLKEGWLEQFFTYLEEKNSVQALQPADLLKKNISAEKVYIPNASYSEMLEWSLPPTSLPEYTKVRDAASQQTSQEAVKSFVRGSLWDMFLARYPESDQILKHVIQTSRKVQSLTKGKKQATARTSILRAQCNCPYWHGLFGGIYLPHLRHGVLQNVLHADALLNERLGTRVVVEKEDYDGDFEEEVIVRSKSMQAFFRPADGGTLAELDHLPSRFSVTNTVSRWKESYHVGEELTHTHEATEGPPSPHEIAVGMAPSDQKNLAFDTLPLRGFRDFVSEHPIHDRDLACFAGMNFLQESLQKIRTTTKGWSGSATLKGIDYQKKFSFSNVDTLSATYTIHPPSSASGYFGTLLPFTLLTPDAPGRKAEVRKANGELWQGKPGDRITLEDVRRVTWEDTFLDFAFDLKLPPGTHVSTVPIQTLQRCAEGYEGVYQGTLIAISWPLEDLTSRPVKITLHLRNV